VIVRTGKLGTDVTKTSLLVSVIGLLWALAVPIADAGNVGSGDSVRKTAATSAQEASKPSAYGKLAIRARLRMHPESKPEILRGITIKVYRGQTFVTTVTTQRTWVVLRAKAGAYRLVWQRWKLGRYVFESKTQRGRVAADELTYASWTYTT
jgi:hypothetical protein